MTHEPARRAEPYIRFTQWKRPWHASSLSGGFGNYDFEYEWALCEQLRRGDRVSIQALKNEEWIGHAYGVDQDEWQTRDDAVSKKDDRFTEAFLTHEDIERRIKRRAEIKNAYDANMRVTREMLAKEKAERKAWEAKYAAMRAAERAERAKAEEAYQAKMVEKRRKQAEQDRLWREEENRQYVERARRSEERYKEQLEAYRLRQEEDRNRQRNEELARRERAREVVEIQKARFEAEDEVSQIMKNKWQCTKCRSLNVSIRNEEEGYFLKCHGCDTIAKGNHATLIAMVKRGMGL
jgi:hypothetical protein